MKGAVLVLILGCNEQVNTCLMTFCVLNLPTQSCYMKNLINVRHLTIKDELVSTVNTDLYIVRHKVRFCPHKSFGSSWLWPHLLEESQTMQMFFLEISSQLSSSSLLINSRSRLHSVGLMFTDDVCHLTQNPLKRDTSAVHICQNPELSPHGALKCALALAPLTQGKLNIRPRLTCLRGYQVMLIPCPVASVSGGPL